ncbi:MAG: hypothetical protein M1813_002248 [Trichoglossum hirsutum]|jgi:hypothetical protein|nr:MAG: hypothetical protein M1813_002248 [Trichoglossum hirsutum]
MSQRGEYHHSPVPTKTIDSPDPEVAVPSRTSTETIEELPGDNALELGGASVSELPGDMPLQHELPLPTYELPTRVPHNSHHSARIFRNQILAKLGMVDHMRVGSHQAEAGVFVPRGPLGSPSRNADRRHMEDGQMEQHVEPGSVGNTHDGLEEVLVPPLNIENGRKRRLEKQRQSSVSAHSALEQAFTNDGSRGSRSLP